MDLPSRPPNGGLKNQGATAYLNTVLQVLYSIGALRKAVYQIPTSRGSNDRPDMIWALQRLFYSLQSSPTAVSTEELTKSFGWGPNRLSQPEDVLEMLRNLMEQLVNRTKGTQIEKVLTDLFVGTLRSYVYCINVDYENSSQPEVFWDLGLEVRDNRSLDDSFKQFIELEKMDGDYQYYAVGHGLQDATKGMLFDVLPPVLILQLKRYRIDFDLRALTKINDFYEFPEEFEANSYLSANADRSEPWVYLLTGVVVHDGVSTTGHNYVFLRSAENSDFYKLDDDRVKKATLKEAVNNNFGDVKEGMNAYVLIYVRKSRLDQVFVDAAEADMPEHLKTEPPILKEEKPVGGGQR